jgi:protein-S-isoprenylcysteine O-methyltransferase Ste14
MADSSKPSLIVVIPTPIWAALIPAALYFVSALLGWQSGPQFGAAGTAVIALGLAFSAWGVLTFRGVGTEVQPSSPTNKALVTYGPYAVTRNPMYVGMVTITLGVALLVGAPLLFAAPVLLFLLDNFVIIPFEEAKMERQFGDAFRAYKARVRRWI